jgi:hypothetical protein
VVKSIKANHELEAELNEMDTKIGLLVRNRIELQDVVKQSKLLKKAQARGDNLSSVLDKVRLLCSALPYMSKVTLMHA